MVGTITDRAGCDGIDRGGFRDRTNGLGNERGYLGCDRYGDAAAVSDAFTADVDRRFPLAFYGPDADVFRSFANASPS